MRVVSIIRSVLLACGVAVLAGLVVDVGPAQIFGMATRLSWRLFLVIAFPFVIVCVFDTLGWRFAFARDRVPFRALFGARMAGEAFNLTTPTASVGGEAVKAWLLRPHVGYQEGLSSVIIAKTTITIAQGLFLLLGVVLAAPTVLHGSALLRAMRWLVGVEMVALAGFVLVQVVGVFGGSARLLTRLGVAGVRGWIERAGRLDGGLRRFYAGHPVRLGMSIGCHFMGWVLSAAETYVIVLLLGVPLSFLTALVIEAFSTGIRFATFFVPGSVGVLEGGHVMTFAALGLGGPAGLAFSLVRRVRELVWIGLGLGVFALIRPSLEPAPAESGKI